ncbi:MAG: peptidoglycan DD-metalloendopeptidase family protein [Nitrospirae bacterium]|jgi:murein DD-endopeptidase MepM/ murein hydrolase activator NlpD|nr:peptidoglycan DD-metalloendopeptidase family protein [Nitrospirota bacterium]
MKKILVLILFLSVTLFTFNLKNEKDNSGNNIEEDTGQPQECYQEISDTIKKGETLYDIFRKYRLDIGEFIKLREASANVHRLCRVYPGRQYKILIDNSSQINEFEYWIDDDNILNIKRIEAGFFAEKKKVEYEKRILHIGGIIKDSLIQSVGEGKGNILLALQLSDIFAWDIDFTTDLRNDDEFRIVAEGLYLEGEFKKYGEILSAEFLNNSEAYRAYRFEYDGEADYYDIDGKSLRRSFLKAPLSFRRISSGFTYKRFHPILKIYRPHLGVDYAAPTGTPVSGVGDGTVIFAGYKGQNGNQVIIKHPNGYTTYYGHLSKFGKGIRKGVKVKQGQVIAYVGSTGLATGPHLDYRVKINNKFVNPLTLKLPRGRAIPEKLMADFRNFKSGMDTRLASITPEAFAVAEKIKEEEKI